MTEVLLLKESVKSNYDYYHFMSGTDMVIKSGDIFDNFFETKENEFISFCGKDWNRQAKKRLQYSYIEAGRNKCLKLINKVYLRIQKIFKVNHLKKIKDFEIVGGSNWCSITHLFATYVLDHEQWIQKVFKHSFCCDELFIHMLAYNSEFKNRIYLLKISEVNDDTDKEMYEANMRLIDWNRGTPYTFRNEDYIELINCPYLFARKFNLTKGNTVSLKILDTIKSEG